MFHRYRMVARGLKTYLPGWSSPGTGGTDSARYCYSVWLRHLTLMRRAGLASYPTAIAELGPGESLGLGLAALLGGARRYVGLDVVRYAGNVENLRVFDELVDLYKRREDLPGDDELPRVRPRLSSYRFADVFAEPETLGQSLAPERVRDLRRTVETLADDGGGGPIEYIVPWYSSDVIEDESMDVAYSQAVLEHVDDLEDAYAALFRWLKPGGMMSHQIDFKCHGMTDEWNGHLSYSDPVWRIIRGRHPFLLNRRVLSNHLDLQKRAGFKILDVSPVLGEGGMPRQRLARRYRDLSDEDYTTSSAHVVSVKP